LADSLMMIVSMLLSFGKQKAPQPAQGGRGGGIRMKLGPISNR